MDGVKVAMYKFKYKIERCFIVNLKILRENYVLYQL